MLPLVLFEEKASGGRWDRPELHRLMGQLRKGDVLVVWKLDRLSRSLKDVLVLMERIAQSGVAGAHEQKGTVWNTTKPLPVEKQQAVAAEQIQTSAARLRRGQR